MAVHEEFLELCAISVTGELTDDERKRLDEHLSLCASCRAAFRQYQATVITAVPSLASELPLPSSPTDSSWSEDAAEAALFRRIQAEDSAGSSVDVVPWNKDDKLKAGYVPPPPRWGQFGMLYAAGILLFAALAICAYRIGERRGVETATTNSPAHNVDLSALKSELSDAGHDKQELLSEIAARDKSIAKLKEQISTRAESGPGKGTPVEPGKPGDLRVASQQNSAGAASGLSELQSRLDSQEKQRVEQLARAHALEARVAELTKQLQDRDEEVARQGGSVRERDDLLQQRESTIVRQQELLAHDRDIRDLMSARDLYIAEVYDVAKTGETNKPYGRIFYTKGKSLLFYAYDLDQQAGLKNASTFQAWGRRGTGHEQPVNLGILYEDSVANKRWVVKSEDARTLEQIDAVFVTVEPNGGSSRPSSKPLLFAYLRIHPNHP
jgi:Putative zinc-finger